MALQLNIQNVLDDLNYEEKKCFPSQNPHFLYKHFSCFDETCLINIIIINNMIS
jgi:hypothetical protein